MVLGFNPDLSLLSQSNDPIYLEGYERGFEDAKRMFVELLKKDLKVISNRPALQGFTATTI